MITVFETVISNWEEVQVDVLRNLKKYFVRQETVLWWILAHPGAIRRSLHSFLKCPVFVHCGVDSFSLLFCLHSSECSCRCIGKQWGIWKFCVPLFFRGKPSPEERFVVTPSFATVGMETTQLTEENTDFASRDRYHHSSVITREEFVNQFQWESDMPFTPPAN